MACPSPRGTGVWVWLKSWSHRRRFALLLLALLLALAALWLLLRELGPEEDPTWARIVETGVLRVCTDPSWPPFESIEAESGAIVGFDVELAERLAQRLAPGVQVRLISVSFDSLYDALLASRCDVVLSALPYEPARTRDVVYSVAYFNAGLVLVVPQGSEIENLWDLAGHGVGVEWGFVSEGNSRQRSFLQGLDPRRYETAVAALRALQAGEVDAALVDRVTAVGYVRTCAALRIVGDPLSDVNYVIPTRLDSPQLLEEINRVLLEMRQDGTLQTLQEQWF
jgi:ABC-type amino acid transport substrate-binding protein